MLSSRLSVGACGGQSVDGRLLRFDGDAFLLGDGDHADAVINLDAVCVAHAVAESETNVAWAAGAVASINGEAEYLSRRGRGRRFDADCDLSADRAPVESVGRQSVDGRLLRRHGQTLFRRGLPLSDVRLDARAARVENLVAELGLCVGRDGRRAGAERDYAGRMRNRFRGPVAQGYRPSRQQQQSGDGQLEKERQHGRRRAGFRLWPRRRTEKNLQVVARHRCAAFVVQSLAHAERRAEGCFGIGTFSEAECARAELV